jgi:hypothetical protein
VGRAAHPYPVSGVAIRLVDYAVISTGKEVETTTFSSASS